MGTTQEAAAPGCPLRSRLALSPCAWLHHVSSRALLTFSLLSSGLSFGCPGQLDDLSQVEDEDASRANSDASTVADAGSLGPQADAGSTMPRFNDEWLSNEAIMELLRDFQYRGEGFRPVNRRPFASTVSPEKTIALWISDEGYDAYTQISPDHAGSKVALPVGTVIVREVLGEEEKLETITVMLRLPDGAFPLGGNWWYASADPSGEIRADTSDGTPLIGLLEDCGTCHLRRSNDDYLFGAPRESLR